MAISNAPIEGTKYSPYELNLGYTPCLAQDFYWEATDRPGQSQTAKALYKQVRQEWDNARLALQSVKDKEMVLHNCHILEESLSINWALSMWLIVGMLESCVGPKEPHREVSLLVETVKEDNRTNSMCPSVCHSIDTVISMSSNGEIIEYKNSTWNPTSKEV